MDYFGEKLSQNDGKEWRYGIMGLIHSRGQLLTGYSMATSRVWGVVMGEIGGEEFCR